MFIVPFRIPFTAQCRISWKYSNFMMFYAIEFLDNKKYFQKHYHITYMYIKLCLDVYLICKL